MVITSVLKGSLRPNKDILSEIKGLFNDKTIKDYRQSKNISNDSKINEFGRFFRVVERLLDKLPEEESIRFKSSREGKFYKKVMRRYI